MKFTPRSALVVHATLVLLACTASDGLAGRNEGGTAQTEARRAGNDREVGVTSNIHVFGNAEAVLIDGEHRADSTLRADKEPAPIPGCSRYEDSALESGVGRAHTQFVLERAAIGPYTLWVRAREDSEAVEVNWIRLNAGQLACTGTVAPAELAASGWHRLTLEFLARTSADTCGVEMRKLQPAERPVPWR